MNSGTCDSAYFNLLGLNNDCIIAILRHVSIADLGCIAFTCQRLLHIANQVLVLNVKNRQYSFQYIDRKESAANSKNDELRRIKVIKAKQILQAFGSFIKDIRLKVVGLPSFESSFLDELVQHCSGTLTSLTVHYFRWSPECLEKAWPLLKSLSSLNTTADQHLLQRTFSELVSFKVKLVSEAHYAFAEFISRHQKLRQLDVTLTWEIAFVLHSILRMQNLEELRITSVASIVSLDIPETVQLERLKKLTLDRLIDDPSPLVLALSKSNASRTLQHMDISCRTWRFRSIACLSRFTNLEVLLLRWRIIGMRLPFIPSLQHLLLSNTHIDNQLIKMLCRLPNLNRLALQQRWQFDDDVTQIQKKSLLNINCLSHLELYDHYHRGELISYLGSTLTLKTLTIKVDYVNHELIANLCRYKNLEELNISYFNIHHSDDIASVDIDNISQLGQLQSLRKLSIATHQKVSFNGIILHLGSTSSMDSLDFQSSLTAETIDGIRRYTNLRTLRLRGITFDVHPLAAIEGLHKLQTLLLSYYTVDWCVIEQIVCRFTSIRTLVFNKIPFGMFTQEEYSHILHICRQQQRKIVIVLEDPTIEIPGYTSEKDNCRFVEVRQSQWRDGHDSIYAELLSFQEKDWNMDIE